MKILFVCLGNICRSPIAEGILRKKFAEYKIEGIVDSAGFESYHINESPDPRAVETARLHGIDISGKRARLFSSADFDLFDRIYVMDHQNYDDVMSFSREDSDMNKVDFLMNLLYPGENREVPDPYHQHIEACEKVYSLLERAGEKIVVKIQHP